MADTVAPGMRYPRDRRS